MLAGGGCEIGSTLIWLTCSRQLSQARPRTASTSLTLRVFDRYMKAQLRLAGGRRKPGRHGFSSDTPRGCRALPYICSTWIWVFAPLSIIGGPSRGVGIYLHTPNRGRAAAGKRYIHTLNRM